MVAIRVIEDEVRHLEEGIESKRRNIEEYDRWTRIAQERIEAEEAELKELRHALDILERLG